jgi:hypothetical protein
MLTVNRSAEEEQARTEPTWRISRFFIVATGFFPVLNRRPSIEMLPNRGWRSSSSFKNLKILHSRRGWRLEASNHRIKEPRRLASQIVQNQDKIPAMFN